MKFENKLLSIINEEINLLETDISGHAFGRVKDRLDSMKAGGDITSSEYDEIKRNLNNILSHEFDSKSYGIFLGGFKPNPKSSLYVTSTEHDSGTPYYRIISNDGVFPKDSTGDEMWAIVRDNEIKTVMLRKYYQRRSMYNPRNVDGGLDVDKPIVNFDKFLEEKRKDKELFQQKMLQKQKENEGIIPVEGVLWVIDAKNQRLYKKNNPKDIVLFDNILSHPAWNENTQEKVFNQVNDYLISLQQK